MYLIPSDRCSAIQGPCRVFFPESSPPIDADRSIDRRGPIDRSIDRCARRPDGASRLRGGAALRDVDERRRTTAWVRGDPSSVSSSSVRRSVGRGRGDEDEDEDEVID